MIFELVVNCVNDLRARWQALQTGLETLQEALPVVDPRRGQLDGPLNNSGTQRAALEALDFDTLREDPVTGLSSLPALLANAHGVFETNRDALLVVEVAANVILDDLADEAPGDAVTAALAVARAELGALRQLIERCLGELEELTDDAGARASLAGLSSGVDNLNTYPVLTQETGFGGGGTPVSSGGGGAGGARPLGAVVENTLRDVLGWRPRLHDTKGFVAALNQSFTCTEVAGRTECVYQPRSLAVTVQADLGAITGAQASIYTRARVALEQAELILNRVYALDPAADQQDSEAARAIVRTELLELVNELGIEGGPRVQRVNALFEQLRGGPGVPFDPELVQGQLGQMRDVLGLARSRVTTVGEEQNLTDFLTLVDYVNSLFQSWQTQSPFFDRSGTATPFLGTQLVLLARQLAVNAESVQELYYAHDSVFLGASERQTIQLNYRKRAPLFVAELLAWADRFAVEEGPRLLQDGGKRGVRAFFPTIDTLTELVRDAQIPPQNPNLLPAGYGTARVQRAWKELEGHLRNTGNLARQLLRNAPAANFRPGTFGQ